MNFPDTITVSVTQEDIDKGIREDCNRCAIALAVARLYPNSEVLVSSGISISTPEAFQTYVIPKEAGFFMDKFDDGEKVEPFTFTTEKL